MCSAPAEHFQDHPTHIDPDSGAIQGALYFQAIEAPTEWFPATAVTLRDGAKHASGVSFMRFPNPADSAAVHLLSPKPDGSTGRVWTHRRIPLTADITFDMRWRAGSLELRIAPDTAWTSVAMPFTPENVVLSCTSGQVVFHDVTITSPLPAEL